MICVVALKLVSNTLKLVLNDERGVSLAYKGLLLGS